jgi:hypothetical protein
VFCDSIPFGLRARRRRPRRARLYHGPPFTPLPVQQAPAQVRSPTSSNALHTAASLLDIASTRRIEHLGPFCRQVLPKDETESPNTINTTAHCDQLEDQAARGESEEGHAPGVREQRPAGERPGPVRSFRRACQSIQLQIESYRRTESDLCLDFGPFTCGLEAREDACSAC